MRVRTTIHLGLQVTQALQMDGLMESFADGYLEVQRKRHKRDQNEHYTQHGQGVGSFRCQISPGLIKDVLPRARRLLDAFGVVVVVAAVGVAAADTSLVVRKTAAAVAVGFASTVLRVAALVVHTRFQCNGVHKMSFLLVGDRHRNR